MAKKKPGLKLKPVQFPEDWIAAIDAARGEESFSDFVRGAVLRRLGKATAGKLSEMPAWGQGRPRKK